MRLSLIGKQVLKMYINIEKTTKLIQEKGCDAVILFNESNMHYICSFSPSEGVIISQKAATVTILLTHDTLKRLKFTLKKQD